MSVTSKCIPPNQQPTSREFSGWREVKVLAHRQLGCLGRCFAKSIAQTTENDLVNSEGSISCVDIKEEKR